MRYGEDLVIFGPDTASNPDFTAKVHKVEDTYIGRTPAPSHLG